MEDQQQQSPDDGVAAGAKTKVSRSVDNLNAEQLAKKRAADRKSQQILREKTRRHIEGLEARVRELQDQELELERARRRTAELEEELRRLRSIIANFQQQTPSGIPLISSASPPQSNIDPDLQSSSLPASTLGSPSVSEIRDYSPPFHHAIKSDGLSSPELNSIPIPAAQDAGNVSIPSTPPIINTIVQRRTPKRPRTVSYPSPPRSIPRNLSPEQPFIIPTSFVKQPTVNVWELPLRVKDPATPVDKLLCGVIETQKSLATEGASRAVAIGPRYPNVNVLVAPQLSHLSHPVSRVLCDLLKRLTYRTFVDKLAALLVMYPLYQWQIMTDYESFRGLPPHSIPCLVQRTTPHHVWICALGTPKLREAVIANQEKYCSEDFMYSFILSLNCNWTRSINDAICWGRDGVSVTKDFWDHCNTIDNFSMDRPFQDMYPELRDAIRFTEYSGDGVVELEQVKE
ncbi:hypothetical protein ONS95_000709 [Cadophora gregata]|uniref:uncharacterized protein n=1 Tax=Cadophora gregata TaxID=51156 RepID=UPI0026DD6191|nr:uncharacterized protein ONS95_000709 [Cadophora gregata]KAK0128758.1 hypothetical protein ONS95_000709 [Cadophora gregata]